jgi:hypothetical protein
MSDDLSKKRELHDAAKELTDNPAFLQAILDLRRRWLDELMTAAETTDEKLALIERMKALEAVPAELKVIMNDYRMAARQKHA